ncbi:MAG: helix-turn-helix domain-containing protein [Planctomycetes bacterium]|nr:helix-turn-helix domain-containing protein [Planctomycetota bacterium]
MNLKDLGRRIRGQREKCRLKQSDIAHALGITAQAVSKWERGENAPDIAVLLDLSRILSVNVDWLLGRVEAQDSTFPATVLCTDMDGYAVRASSMPPRDVATWANGIFYQVTEAVIDHSGVPVKYVGDGFLGFFSGPRHADRAVNAALQLHRVSGYDGLNVLVHSGEIYLGPVGHPEYARPDIIGETVNIAFMALGCVPKEIKSRVAATEKTVELLEQKPRLGKPVNAPLRPMHASIRVYELKP